MDFDRSPTVTSVNKIGRRGQHGLNKAMGQGANKLVRIKQKGPVCVISVKVAFHIKESAQPKRESATTAEEWDTWGRFHEKSQTEPDSRLSQGLKSETFVSAEFLAQMDFTKGGSAETSLKLWSQLFNLISYI